MIQDQPSSATLDSISQLISFDTTSRESNLGLIESVRDRLSALDIPAELVYDRDKRKANLFATIHGARGHTTEPGIVLSGHTDVVPVDGQAWDSDPFNMTLKDGKLFARGACDMKGFIGTALAAVPMFARAELKAPIHLALSYDEEVGCVGVRDLIELLKARNFRAAGVIVGEPTSMRVIVANKGMRLYRCTVHGRSAHSSLAPHGVNAIEVAARIISRIREIGERLSVEETRDPGFDVPHSTLTTGTIRGGTAPNIVPKECVFDWDLRYLPGLDADAVVAEVQDYAKALLPAMHRIAPEADIQFEARADAPGCNAEEEAELTKLVQALAREDRTAKVAYATEAGLFQGIGLPSIVCGPGSIEQAHKPNEFCELAQIARCERFLEALTTRLSA